MADDAHGWVTTTTFSPPRGAPSPSSPVTSPKRRPWVATRVTLVVVLGVLGLGLIVLGLDEAQLANWLIQEGVVPQARLDDPSTQLFKDWTDSSAAGIDVYLQLVAWNVTNPSAVVAGAKPNLVAVGPFTYKQKSVRHSFTFTDNHGTLWFKENMSYHFVDTPCPAGTPPDAFDLKCSIPASTVITTPNVVLMGLLQELEVLGGLEKPIIKFLNRSIAEHGGGETLLMRRNFSEVVFGYTDPLLAEIRKLLGPNSSVSIPDYSIFANNSVSDASKYSAIHTRASDGNFGQVVAWEGHNQTLNCWNGCDETHSAEGRRFNVLGNMINGTSGDFFQPNLRKSDELALFVSDIYRSGVLVYNNSESFAGVEMLRFVLRSDQLANASENPFNCAFSGFSPTGLLNLTGPIGAPIFASKPWFFDGGSALFANLSGYSPPVPFAGHRARYDTYLDIEPESGTVVRAHKRLQINVQAMPSKHVAAAQHLREVFIPIVYADVSTVMPPSVTDGLGSIGQVIDAGDALKYAGPIAGACLITLALFLALFTRRRVLDAAGTRLVLRSRPGRPDADVDDPAAPLLSQREHGQQCTDSDAEAGGGGGGGGGTTHRVN